MLKILIPNRSLLIKVRRILRGEGFLSLIRQFLFIHGTQYVWENTLEISAGIPNIPCKVDNLTLQVIFTPFTLEEFEHKYEEGYRSLSGESLDFSFYPDAKQYRTRAELSRGTIVFQALVGDEIIHRTWVATCREKCGIYHYYYPSKDDGNTAYSGFSMTSENYQGKGILGYVYSEIYHYFRERGFSKVVLAIDKEVVAAHRTQQRLGSKLICEGHTLRVLAFYHYFTSGISS